MRKYIDFNDFFVMLLLFQKKLIGIYEEKPTQYGAYTSLKTINQIYGEENYI